MKQTVNDPVLHFTAGLVSVIKWTLWVGMAISILFLIVTGFALTIGIETDPPSAGNTQEGTGYFLILMSFGALFFFLFARFFRILRNVIDSVKLGSPLSAANADNLKNMAKLLCVILVLGIASDISAPYWLPDSEGCESGNFDYYYNIITNVFLTLLPALLLFILARIFQNGAEIREELEGTV
jgi:Ni,Fe-hydrogenase I cytochrome b subunit